MIKVLCNQFHGGPPHTTLDCFMLKRKAESNLKDRTVGYDVQEVEPGLWRRDIHPVGQTVQGPPKFRTREQAVAACMKEINDGIERRTNRRAKATKAGICLACSMRAT
jgi:hypothetical protein